MAVHRLMCAQKADSRHHWNQDTKTGGVGSPVLWAQMLFKKMTLCGVTVAVGTLNEKGERTPPLVVMAEGDVARDGPNGQKLATAESATGSAPVPLRQC
jgi:hypothetical protein